MPRENRSAYSTVRTGQPSRHAAPYLYVLIFVPQMLGDELHGLGGLGRLRRQDQGVGALALPPLRARLPVDLAVGMVQVGQLHRLHFVLGRRRGARGRGRGQVRRRRVVRMRRAAHARHLHHPPEPRLLRPLHEHARRQVVQEHGPDPRRHPVGPGSCKTPSAGTDDTGQHENET